MTEEAKLRRDKVSSPQLISDSPIIRINPDEELDPLLRDWLMNQNEWQKFTSSPKNIPRISYDIASRFKYAIPLTSKN
ncbi:12205_t:CDS:2, partial [Entrophospora sp. SA101]